MAAGEQHRVVRRALAEAPRLTRLQVGVLVRLEQADEAGDDVLSILDGRGKKARADGVAALRTVHETLDQAGNRLRASAQV